MQNWWSKRRPAIRQILQICVASENEKSQTQDRRSVLEQFAICSHADCTSNVRTDKLFSRRNCTAYPMFGRYYSGTLCIDRFHNNRGSVCRLETQLEIATGHPLVSRRFRFQAMCLGQQSLKTVSKFCAACMSEAKWQLA
jgi:hypothetical protein